jgi:hypothetical protein
MLPQCYPNYKTVHRRFQAWCRSAVLRRVLSDIANELRPRGGIPGTHTSVKLARLDYDGEKRLIKLRMWPGDAEFPLWIYGIRILLDGYKYASRGIHTVLVGTYP